MESMAGEDLYDEVLCGVLSGENSWTREKLCHIGEVVHHHYDSIIPPVVGKKVMNQRLVTTRGLKGAEVDSKVPRICFYWDWF